MTPQAHQPILLVEDDLAYTLLVQRAFRQANVANPLVTLRDGREAIAYLSGDGPYADRQKHPLPVVMLLDLKLPACSGHEVLAWMETRPEICRLPTVVLTTSQSAEDVNRSYDLGANSYVVKPASTQGLRELVLRLSEYWTGVNLSPACG